MKKTEPEAALKFAVLGSTRGSTFQPLLEASQAGVYTAQPVVVLSNRRHAGILEKADASGIESLFVPVSGRNREEYDSALTAELERRGVDFILLIGFMRILGSGFVSRWEGRAVNVHPSLLPLYSGMMDMEIHEAVLRNGDKESGCSVHLVSEVVDGGPVLVQKRCKVLSGDTAETLKCRVQALESEAFLEILKEPGKFLKLTE